MGSDVNDGVEEIEERNDHITINASIAITTYRIGNDRAKMSPRQIPTKNDR